jgi:CRISPR-associated endonuclease/helicase Cas3
MDAIDLGVPSLSLVLLGATIPSALMELPEGEGRGVLSMNTSAESTPEGRRRINARRELTVVWNATGSAGPTDKETVSALVGQVRRLWELGPDGPERIAVFANTVAVAQKVREDLVKAQRRPRVAAGAAQRVELLTSRFRPIDRTTIDLESPGTYVSTQCLEIGVDVTFDAMVTETCPWGPLTQRLGRLNRDGCSSFAHAFLVAGWDSGSDQPTVRKASTSVYGVEPLLAVLRLLRSAVAITGSTGKEPSSSTIDLSVPGIDKLSHQTKTSPSALEGATPRTATVHSGMVPLMTQTRPTPEPDLPIAPFISGPDANMRDEIAVAWRHDLGFFDLDGVKGSDVLPAETVSVSRAALGRLLTKARTLDLSSTLSDVEGRSEDAEPAGLDPLLRPEWIRYWDDRERRWTKPGRGNIRSWMSRARLVVLDPGVGGYDRDSGWTGLRGVEDKRPDDVSILAAISRLRGLSSATPDARLSNITLVLSAGTVADVLHRTEDFARLAGPPVLNEANLGVLAQIGRSDWDRVKRIAQSEATDDDLVTEVCEWASAVLRDALGSLGAPQNIIPGDGFLTAEVSPPTRLRTDDDTTSVPPQSLMLHLRQVAMWASADARAAGVGDTLCGALARAGALHDTGKIWSSFQSMLAGAKTYPEPISKSEGSAEDEDRRAAQGRRVRAARQAGVPEGFRHEALSVSIVERLEPREERSEKAGRSTEMDVLTSHLIGSHHGWYRPFMPLVGGPAQLRGASHADDFAELNRQFGPWGLAYLEAILRLTDWRASSLPWDATESTDIGNDEQERVERYGLDELLQVKRIQAAADEIVSGTDLRVGIDPSVSTIHLSESTSTHDVRMEGLRSHILTGWFAAAGLLAAAHLSGDTRATLRWEPFLSEVSTGIQLPTVPVLNSSLEAREIVERLFASRFWPETVAISQIAGFETSDKQKNGLYRKYQKIQPASALRTFLLQADEYQNLFALGLVGDTLPASRETDPAKRGVELPIPAFSNNSSYPALCFDAVLGGDQRESKVDAALEALVSVDSGFFPEKRDGGMDRERQSSPLVNGRWAKDGRVSRSALAPLALFGMTLLRSGHPRGVGVTRATLALPMPSAPQTFTQLRALVNAGPTRPQWRWAEISNEWIYRATKHGGGNQGPETWIGHPSLRSMQDSV